ncbi:class I tRNA ligase family protein, partial [Klebsiella pneumoniae]|nr:class I tRNA ligase family protein [Klebsiella pneumoniae]
TFDFMTVNHEITNFLTLDMSNFYLDYAKDVVYIELPESAKRRNMQTVMYAVAKAVTTLLTPVIPHTTEEIWTYLQEEEAYA